ncbi:MAG: hypothetical protein ACRC0G_13250 [Fusobacteriaceae bacterium]
MAKVVRSVYIEQEVEDKIKEITKSTGLSFNKVAEILIKLGLATVKKEGKITL